MILVIPSSSCASTAAVQEEIKFVLDREELAHTLCICRGVCKMPLRVTHNDHKAEQYHASDETGKAPALLILNGYAGTFCK